MAENHELGCPLVMRLDGVDALTGRWYHLVDRKVRRDFVLAAEPREAGAGEDGAVVCAALKFPESRVDVAADVLDPKFRIEHTELRATAWRARSDFCAVTHLVDRHAARLNPGVT